MITLHINGQVMQLEVNLFTRSATALLKANKAPLNVDIDAARAVR